MFNKNDIVTVVCVAGEITGKFVRAEGDSNEITLQDPRALTQTEKGVGYAKGICLSGVLDTKEITIKNYIFAVETNEEFVKGYHQTVSGLIV